MNNKSSKKSFRDSFKFDFNTEETLVNYYKLDDPQVNSETNLNNFNNNFSEIMTFSNC